jgi:hypothetical protein
MREDEAMRRARGSVPLTLIVAALAGCTSAPLPGVDGSARDAGLDAARDAASPRDASRPFDAGHDAFAVDGGPLTHDTGVPVDAGSGLPSLDTGPDAGCDAGWCACSTWSGHVVDHLGSSAFPWVRMALAPSGPALAFLDGTDWLDRTDAIVGARAPYGTPSNDYVFGAASHPDALAVVLDSGRGSDLVIQDPVTHGVRAVIPLTTPDPHVGDFGVAVTATGFVVSWVASDVAYTRLVSRAGLADTPRAASAGSLPVAEIAVADAAGALAALYTTPSDPRGVWWQRLDAAGAPLGAPVPLSSGRAPAGALTTASGPAMIGDASGWYAVWAEPRADVPPPPFGPSVAGRYVVAHLAPDGTVDVPPIDLDTSVYWFAPTARLALDAHGRLAMVVTTLVGDLGDALFEVHFVDRDGTPFRPLLTAPTSAYQIDIAFDAAASELVVMYVHDTDVGLWRICDP